MESCYTRHPFVKIDEVALPAIYDSIEFIYKIDKSFGAIVSKEGKFGLSFWEHGSFSIERTTFR